MVENQTDLNPKNIGDDDEINLLDLGIVLLKHKRLILSITLGVAILSVIVSLIITPVYEAKTTIKPFKWIESSIGLAGTPLKTYESLLKSDFVTDRIIKEFNLIKLYKTKNIDETRQKVLKNLDIKVDQETGIITVGYKDKSPIIAAQIANSFVSYLSDLNFRMAIKKVVIERNLFENELEKAHMRLMEAEKSVKNFQKKTGFILLNKHIEAYIDKVANLKAQIAKEEAKIANMGTYATLSNPDYQKTIVTLGSLKAQLLILESSQEGKNALTLVDKMPTTYKNYINPVIELTSLKITYEIFQQLYQEMTIREMTIKEAKGTSLIQVISKATPSQKRIRRALIVLVSTFVAFILSIFIAFVKEFMERASQDEENKERMELIRKYASFKKEK